VKEKRLDLLFLIETKRSHSEMEWICIKHSFQNLFAVDSVGRGGGLALFWQDDSMLSIQNFFPSHIHAMVKTRVDGFE
jgi:hypothetical protein